MKPMQEKQQIVGVYIVCILVFIALMLVVLSCGDVFGAEPVKRAWRWDANCRCWVGTQVYSQPVAKPIYNDNNPPPPPAPPAEPAKKVHPIYPMIHSYFGSRLALPLQLPPRPPLDDTEETVRYGYMLWEAQQLALQAYNETIIKYQDEARSRYKKKMEAKFLPTPVEPPAPKPIPDLGREPGNVSILQNPKTLTLEERVAKLEKGIGRLSISEEKPNSYEDALAERKAQDSPERLKQSLIFYINGQLRFNLNEQEQESSVSDGLIDRRVKENPEGKAVLEKVLDEYRQVGWEITEAVRGWKFTKCSKGKESSDAGTDQRAGRGDSNR